MAALDMKPINIDVPVKGVSPEENTRAKKIAADQANIKPQMPAEPSALGSDSFSTPPVNTERSPSSQWDWGEILIGATPVLAGLVMGEPDVGFSAGGSALLQRQKDLMELNKQKIKALKEGKPLTKSNVLEVMDPEGRRRYARVEEAVGQEVPEDTSRGLTFDQQKALATHKAKVKSQFDKGAGSFKNEKDLRTGYSNDPVTKQTKDRSASYSTIKSLYQAPQTSANDLSMIFAYMKMLDPTSVVREGEQQTARKTGAIPDVLWNQYQRLTQGKDRLLPPSVRDQFAEEAGRIYKSQLSLQNQVDNSYTSIANQYGLSPANVLINPRVDILPPKPQGKSRVRYNGRVIEIPKNKVDEFLKDFGGEEIE